MLFNSLSFAIFLPLAFCGYWTLRRFNLGTQNLYLLAISYLFYGWWDWRFLGLIALSSVVDFFVGIKLSQATAPSSRRFFLLISLSINLGILFFFKYFGFFVDSFIVAMESIGIAAHRSTLQIILPVGISFYTFQTLSYSIDIYRGKARATRDPIAFFAYVSFFPQLVAGPIERATTLLPQFLAPRRFERELASDGMRQILWGLFKKMVIADNLAPAVDAIFANPGDYPAPVLLLGVIFFAFQIYCDFSGYSDIAIGVAKLFGFRLMTNFAYPYFSRDIGEFWRRWHISLSTWFRDYVYIPLGGSQVSTRLRYFSNLMITFMLSGLWHGANWTFLFWGFLHGLYYLPLVMRGKHKRYQAHTPLVGWLPDLRSTLQITFTFIIVCFAWVFFRADSMTDAMRFLGSIGNNNWDIPNFSYYKEAGLILILVTLEWLQRQRPYALEISHLPIWVRWPCYYAIAALILGLANLGEAPFIYFQF